MPITAGVNLSTLPPWLDAIYHDIADRAKALHGEKYEPSRFGPKEKYPDFNADILQAMDLARNGMGEYAPYLTGAQGLLEQGAEKFPDHYAEYANPHEEQVVKDMARLSKRNYEENFLPQLEAQFVGMGSHGSSRHGDLAARGARDAQEALLRQQAELKHRGYETAGKLFNVDKARALEAAGPMAELGRQHQAGRFADVAALSDIGNRSRELEQNRTNEGVRKEEEQKMFPWEQLGRQSATMAGIPQQQSQFNAYQKPGTPQLNTAGNIAGLATGLYGAHMAYGRKEGGSIKRTMNIPRLRGLKPQKGAKAPKKGLGSMSLSQSSMGKAPKVGGKYAFNKKKAGGGIL